MIFLPHMQPIKLTPLQGPFTFLTAVEGLILRMCNRMPEQFYHDICTYAALSVNSSKAAAFAAPIISCLWERALHDLEASPGCLLAHEVQLINQADLMSSAAVHTTIDGGGRHYAASSSAWLEEKCQSRTPRHATHPQAARTRDGAQPQGLLSCQPEIEESGHSGRNVKAVRGDGVAHDPSSDDPAVIIVTSYANPVTLNGCCSDGYSLTAVSSKRHARSSVDGDTPQVAPEDSHGCHCGFKGLGFRHLDQMGHTHAWGP